MRTFPRAGGSSGAGREGAEPEINPLSQLWQTPVRHDQRTGTSHASASSSRLWSSARQRVAIPLRAKDTSGPVPALPAGWCGARGAGARVGGGRGAEEARVEQRRQGRRADARSGAAEELAACLEELEFAEEVHG